MTETLFDMENLNCLNCGRPLDAGVCGWCDVRPLHRKNDPVTSMRGARDVAPRAGSQKALLLEQYRLAYPGGLTDEEAAAAAGLHTGAWKRCSDLRNADLIEPTGETRKSSAGSEAMVCRWKDVHARSSNPVPVPADAPTHSVCRYCGYGNGDHADYCSEWPEQTCNSLHPGSVGDCAGCRAEAEL